MNFINFKLTTAVAAIMILAASCGQNSAKQKSAEQETQETVTTINDEKLSALLMEIYYKLPASVMPDYLKTEAQRRETDASEYSKHANYLFCDNFPGDGLREQWRLAGYLTDDNNNIVLIIQYGGGYDGYYGIKLDKTLNYNIQTGTFTEIERPIEPFTSGELIDDNDFDTTILAEKAKKFFNENKTLYYRDFNKDGFEVEADIISYDDDDYMGEQNRVISSRKWNGRKFVQGTRWHLDENGNKIPYSG